MFRIGDVAVGGSEPCRFIAEMSNAHGGNADRMRRMIAAAKASGASLIKTQAFLPSELVALRGDGPAPEPWGSAGWSMRSLYEKAATPLEWFDWIPDYCAEIGIPWFSSVFGEESLATLERAGCPAYKIGRLDNAQSALSLAVVQTGKPTLVSFSMEEMRALALVGFPEHWPFIPLVCPPGYPPRPEDIHLPRQFRYGTREGWVGGFLGLSSHCLDPLLPVAAVARGAKMLEYHFQLDEEPSELEANVSLTASQFRQMVNDVRRVEGMLA